MKTEAVTAAGNNAGVLAMASFPGLRLFQSAARAIDNISYAAATFGGLIMLAAAFLTNYEIFSRYIFNSPTTWTLQVCVYILIWFGFISLAQVQRTGRHIRVDLLLHQMQARTRMLWDMIGMLFSIVFVVIFTWFAWDFFHEAWSSGEVSPDMLASPMWIPKVGLVIGPALFLLQIVRDLGGKSMAFVYFQGPAEEKNITAGNIAGIVVYLALLAGAWWLFRVSAMGGLLCLMLLLLFGGVPIFAALGLVGMAGMSTLFGGFGALNTVPNIAYGALNHFALASLPLFILAGQILEKGGAGKELYDMCARWLGGMPGGLAGATILACAIFSAISLASVATAATIGLIALPELARRNYDKKLSYGVVAAGGTLGLMIPPSGTMIIYSAVTEESLGQLFMAGLVPGIMLSALLLAYAVWFCKRTGRYDKSEATTWRQKAWAVKTGFWALLAPVIILAGIYSGIFTPLEAAGVVVIYAFLMTIIRGQVGMRGIVDILRDCCVNGGMILVIIAGALIMGTFVTLLQIPAKTITFIEQTGISPWQVIVVLMLLYFLLGMFLEVVSVMLITLPVVYPLITSLGFDGIWFAVLVTLNMEIAVITPPVGLNLYVIKGLTGAPLMDILKGVMPFFFIMLLGLIIIAIFPPLSTWLPTAMFH